MANAIWDPTLPQDVLVEAFEETFPNGLVRTQMETGPAKQRRRFTATTQTVKCEQEMSRAQVESLLTMFRDTLAMGALPVDWVNARTLVTTTFRFTAPPVVRPMPGSMIWRAAYELEIMP